jgi:hypothetical protein
MQDASKEVRDTLAQDPAYRPTRPPPTGLNYRATVLRRRGAGVVGNLVV